MGRGYIQGVILSPKRPWIAPGAGDRPEVIYLLFAPRRATGWLAKGILLWMLLPSPVRALGENCPRIAGKEHLWQLSGNAKSLKILDMVTP
jgi:hypothetical protein